MNLKKIRKNYNWLIKEIHQFNKNELAKKFMLFKMRYNRGTSHFSFLTGLVFSGAVIVKLYNIPLIVLPFLTIIGIYIFYYIGDKDEKIIQSWQFENQYQTEELNPTMREIRDNQRLILTILTDGELGGNP